MADTLHQRIRSDIETRILSGTWEPGYRIPFEHELMEQYRCSRMTVNKALSSLAEAGLIERRRRAGSFVARPLAQSAVLQIPDIPAEITARGDAYGYELLSSTRRKSTQEDRDRLRATGNGVLPVLDLCCRHLARGEPFAIEERLMNLAIVPEDAITAFKTTPPGTWLLHHVPWTEAENRIYAVQAGPAKAKLLGVAPDKACLVVERRTWRGADTVTFVRLTYPGDLYQLVAQFTPTR
ncbi:histidine utilization repressor [Microvirga pudoricolor]|uniref:histidine utilization repressor n=1 Tax=Microvirga pudoricolor TaxID=2778729 RepID=UPI00194F0248|nr:histidine utilization repressor [Microvirga pudoricolor]MBM6593687.1 histidine utilization repressor [Microvirga pudoricolor]